jgi:hypothetical protein
MTHYRRVDHSNQGWYMSSQDGTEPVYTADYGWKRHLPKLGLTDLELTRGPTRPVLPIGDQDLKTLARTFDALARRTITTLAAALEQTYHLVRESAGGLANPDSADYAKQTLTAGDEGSWESAVLYEVVLVGNGLNVDHPRRNMDNRVEARRARGPARRVDAATRDRLADMFARWHSDPERYTEFAATLAAAVSAYCDARGGPDGWRCVADQWMMPGALARQDFIPCYRLFYSVSEHMNADLL